MSRIYTWRSFVSTLVNRHKSFGLCDNMRSDRGAWLVESRGLFGEGARGPRAFTPAGAEHVYPNPLLRRHARAIQIPVQCQTNGDGVRHGQGGASVADRGHK